MQVVNEAWLMKKLYEAYLDARKNKRHTKDVYLFELNLADNLKQLCADLIHRRYKPSRGIAFVIKRPVMREIFAAPFRDRIVHHLLYNLSYDWWDRRLIYDSYSCRNNKGTLFGVMRLKHFIHSVSKDYTQEAYVMKLDLKGYFMSMPRSLLYERVVWGLERQFANNMVLLNFLKYVWKEIVFDDPTKEVFIRGKHRDWRYLPKSKSLFCQPAGRGIVIGNLSSQMLSNILLDALDRYVKYDLKYKCYGRYVDDSFFVVTKDELPKLKKDVKKIEKFLSDELGLTLHPNKRYLQEVHKGVEFLGVVIYPYHIVPTRRFMNNFYRAAAEVGMGYRDDSSVLSYLGHSAHCNSSKMTAKVFRYYGWNYWY